ncbi:MAG: RNA polymerase sigma factor [Anaerolineae bacterium]
MSAAFSDYQVDELTLRAARGGDLRACERIYRQFQRPAYTLAMRVVHCPDLAQDVSQEAFISAFRRLRQYRGDAPFWAWLKRVIVNHAISALRRQPQAELVTFDDYRASVPGEQDGIGAAMDLETALQQLGRQDRAIVWLHDVEGYKHEEIADMFGKTTSFSKTRLARARSRLRLLISPDDTAVGVLAQEQAKP